MSRAITQREPCINRVEPHKRGIMWSLHLFLSSKHLYLSFKQGMEPSKHLFLSFKQGIEPSKHLFL